MGVVSLDEAEIQKFHILNNFESTLELLRDGGCNDVTIICRDGKFTSNSFLLAAIFKVIRNIFQDMQFSDESMVLIIPDMDLIEFELFFESIHQGKKSFRISEGIFYLLHGRSHSLHEDHISLKNIEDEDYEKEIKEENINDDFDNVDHVVDIFDPFDEDDNEHEATKVDVKDITSENIKEEYTDVAGGNDKTIISIKKENMKKKRIWKYDAQCQGECGDSNCRKICRNNYSLQRHIQAEVGKKILERKRFKDSGSQCHGECGDESCRKMFSEVWRKQRHVDAATYVPQTCPICGIIPKFQNAKDGITKHLEEHEGGWEGKSRCKICRKSIPTEEIEQHVSGCNPGVVCPICGKLLKTQSQLPKHIESTHGKLKIEDFKPCHICGKEFKSVDLLQAHVKRYHKEKEACPHCGDKVRNLKKHIEGMHTLDKDKKYQCQDCGKGFMEKQKLEIHRMNVHLKLQPYKCRYGCDIAYNDVSNRNQHEKRTHGKLFVVVRDEKMKAALNNID